MQQNFMFVSHKSYNQTYRLTYSAINSYFSLFRDSLQLKWMKKLRKILSVKGQSCQNIHDQLIYNRLRESGHFSKNLKITVNKGKKRKGKGEMTTNAFRILARNLTRLFRNHWDSRLSNEIGSTSGKSGDTLQLSITSDNW